jgi:hypothetical protein
MILSAAYEEYKARKDSRQQREREAKASRKNSNSDAEAG